MEKMLPPLPLGKEYQPMPHFWGKYEKDEKEKVQ
jgi:hypothetical protein